MKTVLCLLALAFLPSILFAQTSAKYRVYLGTGKNIYQLELDTADGKMTKPIVAAEIANPSFVAIHPNQKFLYSVSETDKKPSISAFAIDAKTGSLTLLNSQSSGGSGPCHVTVDRDGTTVMAANYSGGSCTSIPIKTDGSLGTPASVYQHKGMSILPNQKGPHAHSINMDKANQFAFCADLGLDKMLVYRLDPKTGTLTPNDPPAFDLEPGTGPRHFAFHPDGKHAYINGEMSMTIVACDYDPAKGVLTKKQTLSTLPKDETRKNGSTAEVVVHPSGKFVYVSNRDPYNSIAIFSIDPKTFELKAVGHQAKGVKTPRNFAIEPTGKYMLVANQNGKSVIVFAINPDTGELMPTESRVEVASPVCVRFVPLTK